VTPTQRQHIALIKGETFNVPFTVAAWLPLAAGLAAGQYPWSLAVWAYDNNMSFTVPVTITVTPPAPLTGPGADTRR